VRVDLNADVGELSAKDGGHDAELLKIVTSASVACGMHAGDLSTMNRTVMMAASGGVAVGAHPGFADRANFGRREMNLSSGEIFDLVLDQIRALAAIAKRAGVWLQHVKPHGALYNMSVRQKDVAEAIATAVAYFDRSLVVIGLPKSELLLAAAKAGLPFGAEGFADRSYESDGSLTSRQVPGAVIDNPKHAAERAVQMIQTQQIIARDGSSIRLQVQTICVHGDTPGAVAVASAVRQALENSGITVAPLRS
jgi:UPF0271 protein